MANLKEVMSNKTDGELFAILHAHPGDYTAEAIVAASEEFNHRSPSQRDIDTFTVAAESEREAAGTHLGWGLRILAFFISPVFFFIPVLLAHRHFMESGERQKAREWGRFALYGFVFYLAAGILVRLLG